jgi:hypothetical protein
VACIRSIVGYFPRVEVFKLQLPKVDSPEVSGPSFHLLILLLRLNFSRSFLNSNSNSNSSFLSLHHFLFLNIYHNLPYIRLNATYPLYGPMDPVALLLVAVSFETSVTKLQPGYSKIQQPT